MKGKTIFWKTSKSCENISMLTTAGALTGSSLLSSKFHLICKTSSKHYKTVNIFHSYINQLWLRLLFFEAYLNNLKICINNKKFINENLIYGYIKLKIIKLYKCEN